MLVGDPMDIVRGVAVALDPTIHAVEKAPLRARMSF